TDGQQRQVGLERPPRQLQLVIVTSHFGGGELRMRGFTVERRQHVAPTGQEQTIGSGDDVLGSIDGAIEIEDLTTGALDRRFVVVRLAARSNGNDRHVYILAGTAIPMR